MKISLALISAVVFVLLTHNAQATVRYVDLNSTNATLPYIAWSTAATNIQDAINAASPGDTVWVTNGVYLSGGKVMSGDLTNRVTLDKALTVQSVNGPLQTFIQGEGATNGTAAVRCAWLTNGAVLKGFTLQNGGTRSVGDLLALQSGGGVWCSSGSATVANCVIKSNTANAKGGGSYFGTLNNCLVIGNSNSVAYGSVFNCLLINCTVTHNLVTGTSQSVATNCVIYFNAGGNYSGGTYSYSCSTPPPAGNGNIGADPQLLPDNFHLSSSSPCRGTGTNLVSGTDLDGQSWNNPPSIGCDEWQPQPIVVMQPSVQLASDPAGLTLSLVLAGQTPFTCWWTRNGTPLENDGHYSSAHTTNLMIAGINPFDLGNYQVVVSNASGMATSGLAQVVGHFVSATSSNPMPPYLSWATAATNIQDAINVSLAQEIVLVTNGVYTSGGKVMGGDLTNRVALDKMLLVQSINGPQVTVIQGVWDPATNGLAAIRCAWLTNGAVLSGFTLMNGATRAVASTVTQQMNGGGVWGASTNATLFNCTINACAASYKGGGAYQVTLNSCALIGNQAVGSGMPGMGIGGAGAGGGAVNSMLKNCVVTGNIAIQGDGGGTWSCNLLNCALTKNSCPMNGGAANAGTLINCTVTANNSSGYSGNYGAAVYGATLSNCIVRANFLRTTYPNTNYANCTLAYCCTDPLAAGTGNISVDPQLLDDGVHLASTSPCRAAGNSNLTVGTDIDGQAWATPPSIGCDEWQPVPAIATQPGYRIGPTPRSLSFTMSSAGQGAFTYFWSKDGVAIQDDQHYASSGTANMVVSNFGPADAGSYEVVVSNLFGVATSQVAQVVIHAVDAGSLNPSAPYSSWATAATNIQDAINVSLAGDIVLVTNGLYATGGKVMSGDLTNRVALDKALTVQSVNGYAVTTIQGAWDPATTNGPAAVRCAWLSDGAVLSGFTLRGGATRGGGFITFALQYGGGAWCASTNAVVSACQITNNSAQYGGGGASFGTLNGCFVTGNIAYYGYGAGCLPRGS